MYFNFIMIAYWWWQPSAAQMVEALRYEPEGRGFDPRWCQWNFSFDIILPAALWPPESTKPLTEMSTSKGGRCVGLKNLPPSCADVLKSGSLNLLETSGPVQACIGIAVYFYEMLENVSQRRTYSVTCAAAGESQI